MNSNAPPAINPSDDDTLTGAFRHIVNNILSQTDTMLPAQVISYIPGTLKTPSYVELQPLVSLIDTNGKQINRPSIPKIPVFTLGGGGFVINFPLIPGDLGWIIANDRDISQFLQTLRQSSPNTYRKKSFSDAVFFPHKMKGYSIDPTDADNFTIQSMDGLLKISIGAGKIKLTAPIVEVDGALAINGGMTATGPGATPINITGNVFVTGDISATGSITPDVPPP